MTVKVVHSFRELQAALENDGKRIAVAVQRARRKAAREGVKALVRLAPVAFGELRDSFDDRVRGDVVEITSDSTHVLAVDRGSAPHWVPLAPLIAWVRIKAGHGTSRTRAHRRLAGASEMAAAVAAHTRDGVTPIDAPERVARAIQRKIAEQGTKPHHFIAKALPQIKAALDQAMARELEEASKRTAEYPRVTS